MYTEHDVNITLPPPPHERKSSLRQVRQMFTSASLGNSPNTSCRHCMRTTEGPRNTRGTRRTQQSEHIMQALHEDDGGAQEHTGYSADATTPWHTCSGLPVGLDETAPHTGRLPSEKFCARTPAASPPKTFCSVMSQTGRGPAGWTGSVPHHAAAEGQPR